MADRDEIILPDGRVLPLRSARPATLPAVRDPAGHQLQTTPDGRNRRRGKRSDDDRGAVWNVVT